MNNQNNPLDFSQLKRDPKELSKHLKAEIYSIFQEISSERATKFDAEITSFVQANPEYHWTLFFCRQCCAKFLENAQPEKDSDYDQMVYLFSFSDIDRINEFATINNIDLNALDEIDFIFNTNLSVWQTEDGEGKTFLDAAFHIWEMEKKLVNKDQEAESIYLNNVVLTMISSNFAELTRSRYNLDSMAYAKIIWTILENSISSSEKHNILRNYFSEDNDYVLVVDAIYFYFEQFLHIDLENEYNSESDELYSNFQGYRTDFVALSKYLLEMDLFDL